MDIDSLPRSPLKTAPSTNQEFHRFIESPERLILRPGMLASVVMVGFAVVMILLFSPIGIGDAAGMPGGFGCLLLIFMTLFGLLSAIAGIMIHKWSMRATFDLLGGELLLKGLRFRNGLRIDLRDVVALQILRGDKVTPDEGPGLWHHELNVAWQRGDAIERTCLLHHMTDRTLRRIAGRIAERLGVPVIDHAVEGEASSSDARAH